MHFFGGGDAQTVCDLAVGRAKDVLREDGESQTCRPFSQLTVIFTEVTHFLTMIGLDELLLPRLGSDFTGIELNQNIHFLTEGLFLNRNERLGPLVSKAFLSTWKHLGCVVALGLLRLCV